MAQASVAARLEVRPHSIGHDAGLRYQTLDHELVLDRERDGSQSRCLRDTIDPEFSSALTYAKSIQSAARKRPGIENAAH